MSAYRKLINYLVISLFIFLSTGEANAQYRKGWYGTETCCKNRWHFWHNCPAETPSPRPTYYHSQI